ncbi:MAG: hypothetical protein KIPDCIKN_01977 [Haliscomenobacter sp.]|nr:hypothetical protein [Haliscomenobacter sp.]
MNNIILEHYKKVWHNRAEGFSWTKGPINELPFSFRILEFPPDKQRRFWTYATCGLSDAISANPLELHIFSSDEDKLLIELLTVVAHFHTTNPNKLGLWHTINFGKPWKLHSNCDHGLISLPYLDGPNFESLWIGGKLIKFYWLVPITPQELAYKKTFGIEALEILFEEKRFNYLDPERASVI